MIKIDIRTGGDVDKKEPCIWVRDMETLLSNAWVPLLGRIISPTQPNSLFPAGRLRQIESPKAERIA